MPKLTNMQNLTIPGSGNFQFSAIRPDKLGATEYTLVTIVVDVSWSVSNFSNELLDCIKAIIAACKHSARADNLMVRLTLFNDRLKELHGFVPLSQLKPDDYQALKCNGATALYDATFDSIAATNTYAKILFDQDFDVNAAIYIITDGEDNRSQIQREQIAKQVRDASHDEFLESLVSVLVGVNTSNGTSAGYLQLFRDEAELTQFIDIAQASPDALAQLAAFVGKSISAQSQALGTGQASVNLTF